MSGRRSTYPDAYIDRWGEVFVRWQLRLRLGIDFEQFLADPGRYLRQVPANPLPEGSAE